MEHQALTGLRVVDLSNSAAGAWCSRMFADFGADVVMVEPTEGHGLRRRGPFGANGESVPANHFLADRRSVVLDLASPPDAAVARRMGRHADIVVSGSGPSLLEQSELRYQDFDTPSLVMVHTTHWGMTGELADAPGNDLAVAARSGWASINGRADREPLKPSGWQVSYCTGTVAYVAALAAVIARDSGAVGGQEIDIAALDVMASAFAPAVLRGLYDGREQTRSLGGDLLGGPVPVADGYFALTISRAHFWRDAMNLLGLPDLAEDPRWETAWYRHAHRDEYNERVQSQMRNWNKWELFEELAIRRVVAGPVTDMAELRASEHLQTRGFWRRPEADRDGPEHTGPPFRMSATPATFLRGAPKRGEHTDEVLAEIAE